MPSPALVFAFILSTLFGAVFHLMFGGGAQQLAQYLIAAWVGFAIGQFAGVILEVNLFNIGIIRFFAASVGAVLALVLARYMSFTEYRRRGRR